MNKQFHGVEIKDADRGTVACVFSTKRDAAGEYVIDKDGDVTLDGAFSSGAKVAISAFGHQSWSGKLPVGKGTIRETATEAIFEGRFFVDTQHGHDTFETVKEMSAPDGPGQEWSYSLRDVVSESGVLHGRKVRFLKKITVHEVSPVLVGAGVDTRTLAVKRSGTFAEHAATVLGEVDVLVERACEIKALREPRGKGLGEVGAVALQQLDDQLTRLKGLVGDDSLQAVLEREYAAYLETCSRLGWTP